MKFKILMLFAIITQFLYSEDKIFDLNYDWGGIGFGTTYELNNKFYFDFTANFFEVFVENRKSGLGFTYNPIKYNYSSYFDDHLLNLSNLKVYLNLYEFPFRINRKNNENMNYIVGPFFSIDLLNIYNFNKIDFIDIYYVGFIFYIKYGDRNYSYANSFLNFELGYKNHNNKPSIYFGIKINYFSLIGIPVIIVDHLIYGGG